MSRFGRIVFALAFVALGALTLAWRGFMDGWQPLPRALPGREATELISGAVVLASSAALLWPRARRPAALVLAGFLAFLLLLFQGPGLAARPLVEGLWEQASEMLIYIAGAWMIFALAAGRGRSGARSLAVRAGQIAFALALPAIGLSHMFYLNLTVPLIPTWLPFHVALAWFTGAAHIAAGVAILVGIVPRLAATLEAVMTSLFTIIVWPPALIAAPAIRSNWSEICVSAAIAGAAWLVAGSFAGRPWGLARRR